MAANSEDTESTGSRDLPRTHSENSENTAAAVGTLPSGSRFGVPETLSVVSFLFRRRSWKSPATLLWIFSSILTACSYWLFFLGVLPLWFFCFQFVVWRLVYNVGLGIVLHYQSRRKSFLLFFRRLVKHSPSFEYVLGTSVVIGGHGNEEYRMDKYPDEYNAWLLFRILVNIVLSNDLVSYVVLALACCQPIDLTAPVDVLCFLVGSASIVFALWSKTDAHRVIGDYAWYWGDFFFLLDKKLVFDGIFQMFPHPMYTLGYAFMYGVPLMAKSYTLFYLSVFGHLSQLLFLALVENPHITRTYGVMTERTEEEILQDKILYAEDGEGLLSRSELVVLKSFNPFRDKDILLALFLLYAVLFTLLPAPAWVFSAHHVFWRLFLNLGLGLVLYKEVHHDKWFSNHFSTPKEAFFNWRTLYNTAVTMANATYFLAAIRYFSWNMPFFVTLDSRIFTLIVGLLLLGINVYVSLDIYKVVGDFGYFYGDFFFDRVPSKLTYTGIYRYLNNPDSSLGMSGCYGIALISGSPIVLCLAIFSHVCAKAFEIFVEKPHVRRRYGATVRDVGGLEQELRSKLNSLKLEYERRVGDLKEELERRKSSYKLLRKKISSKAKERTKLE